LEAINHLNRSPLYKDINVKFLNSCGDEEIAVEDGDQYQLNIDVKELVEDEVVDLETPTSIIELTEHFSNTKPDKCPITEYKLVEKVISSDPKEFE
jgi:hypothetical protein